MFVNINYYLWQSLVTLFFQFINVILIKLSFLMEHTKKIKTDIIYYMSLFTSWARLA